MVQIIDGPKSFGSSFVSALAEKLPDALGQLIESRRAAGDMEKENEALEKLGVNATGIKNPKLREKLLEGHVTGKKKEADELKLNQGGKIIGKFFNSPEVEEVWPHLTEGGRTEATKRLLDDRSRGMDTRQSLGQFLQENPDSINLEGLQQNQMGQNAQFGNTVNETKVGRTPKERVKEDQETLKFKREHESKLSDKLAEEAYETQKSFPGEQADIDLIKSATDYTSGFDRDYLADITGFEPLRTAKGTQLKSAGKNLFLKTIQQAGTRPNQWIEQQIGSAMTQLGKTKASNDTIAEMMQFQLDVKKKRAELIDEISEKYEKQLGYVPFRATNKEVTEKMKEYATLRQDQMAYDLRKIYEEEQGIPKLINQKVKKDTPLTREMAKELLKKANGDADKAEKMAKRRGYTIPREEIFNR